MISKNYIAVGYALIVDKSHAAFPAPRIVGGSRSAPRSRRAVQSCPAVNVFEARLAEILSPFSIRLRLIKRSAESFDLHLVPDGTRLDADLVRSFVSIMPQDFWRREACPVVQIAIPYCFVCDQVCYLTQLPPYLHQSFSEFPGLFISGRFPTHIWPRTLNLAFEWIDLKRDLVINRNAPISYVLFETDDPTLPIRLVRAVVTDELKRYRAQMEDVPKFTSGSFSLMGELSERRPTTLLSIESGEYVSK